MNVPVEQKPGHPSQPNVEVTVRRGRSLKSSTIGVAKQLAFLAYLNSGCVRLRRWSLCLLGRAPTVVVYYHRIGGRDVLSRPVDAFRQDLDYLRRHYRCVTLWEYVQEMRSDERLRTPLAAVTFDDGYRDNFTHAAPVLREMGVPATFFVSTGFIGTERPFPHDERMELRGEGTACHAKLTWDDLRAMQEMGFEIGSHTVDHVNLGQAEPAMVRRQLEQSLTALSRELGHRPRAFSFPWGKPMDMSAVAVEAARSLGYYAVATAYGGKNQREPTLYEVRRVDVGNGHLARTAVRARFAGLDPDYRRYLREASRRGWRPPANFI